MIVMCSDQDGASTKQAPLHRTLLSNKIHGQYDGLPEIVALITKSIVAAASLLLLYLCCLTEALHVRCHIAHT